MKRLLFLIQIVILPVLLSGQTLGTMADYLRIHAKANDPLYTTYAATMARSRLYGDKAYKMDYYSDCRPVTYTSDHAGSMFAIWKVDGVVIMNTGEFIKKPVIESSFPDMMVMEYEPFRGIHVKETFLVYSSTLAVVDMEVKNTDNIPHEITVYPVLELGNDSLEIMNYNEKADGYITHRYESPYRLISSLKTEYPYPFRTRDFFTANQKVYSFGGYPGDMSDFYNRIKTDYYSDKRNDSLNLKKEGFVDFIALQLKKRLRPGETTDFRYLRGVQSQAEVPDSLFAEATRVKPLFLKTFFEDNLMLFGRIPRISFKTEAEKLVYIGAFNLVRGSMYPATGKTRYNFYAFSRNPLWGWGHGHQVLHESLSMLSYVYLDPLSAEGSQRVYMEQQDSSGLIAYRHGPRGKQDYPHKNMPTTSAPFFSWINWEVYKVSKDKQFLQESYAAGSKYVHWLIRNRDTNHDGTFEWGPYGIIENVRDWYNAVFQVSAERYLDVDKEDISDELECLDLTLMVIKEERSLAKMASSLGKAEEAREWQKKAENTTKLVNERMWDDSTGFYYSVNKKDYSFKFMTRDLKRQEIIGFLALWAEAAPKDRAEKLLKTLTDTTRFWRKYGVPTLSAQDPWFSPYVDYCCKWNGPVWLLWDYMVYDGLKNYGYNEVAKQLAAKMMLCVTTQLSKNHNFWESFSPDNEVLNCPSNYIWDSIMAKLIIEENNVKPSK
jgi:Trehalase